MSPDTIRRLRAVILVAHTLVQVLDRIAAVAARIRVAAAPPAVVAVDLHLAEVEEVLLHTVAVEVVTANHTRVQALIASGGRTLPLRLAAKKKSDGQQTVALSALQG